MSEINKRHDELRHKLMTAMRRAGSREEVLELQRALEEAHAHRGKELRAAGRVRWDGVVVWGPPGREVVLREE